MGGSRIVWSSAEFQTIAASLHRLSAFEPLLAYARETMRREPADPTARFYRIVAQVKGDRDRLTDAQETELYDLMDEAGSRQEFHMLNRVQRFLDGPVRMPTGRWRPASDSAGDVFDADDMEELLGMAATGMAGDPGQGGPQAGERIRHEPGDRHAGRRCGRLAARRHSLEPAGRGSVRDARRARDGRPLPTGAAMTGSAAVEAMGNDHRPVRRARRGRERRR